MRDALLHLFPSAVLGRDFTLRDDGDGPFIAEWNLTSPKPTSQQMLVAGQAVLLASLCRDIDQAADHARAKVVGDPVRTEEYKLAAAEAAEFKAAGYPPEAVPRTVAAWVLGDRTAQQAADSILLEATQYNEALYLLRETRLQAKELVRQAIDAGNVAQAQDIAAETIASIEAAVAGIGNNPR